MRNHYKIAPSMDAAGSPNPEPPPGGWEALFPVVTTSGAIP